MRRRSLAAPAAKLCKAFRRYGHRRSSHLSARPEVRRRSLAAPAAKLCKAFRRYGHRRFFTFPLDRRYADALSPPRRQDSARLSDVTDTGDFFHPSARPEVRRRSLAAPAAKLCKAFRRYGHRRFFHPSARPEVQHRPQAKNVHGSELPCTFSICVCPRLRRGRRVPGSGCAAARGRGP